jgi:hypothetical protein
MPGLRFFFTMIIHWLLLPTLVIIIYPRQRRQILCLNLYLHNYDDQRSCYTSLRKVFISASLLEVLQRQL